MVGYAAILVTEEAVFAGFIEAGGKTSDDNLFVVPHANWSQCRTATGR